MSKKTKLARELSPNTSETDGANSRKTFVLDTGDNKNKTGTLPKVFGKIESQVIPPFSTKTPTTVERKGMGVMTIKSSFY